MAIDPRISLAAQAPKFGVGSAINIFENAMMNSQARQLNQEQGERAEALAPLQLQAAQQGVTANKLEIDAATENRILKSINDFAVGNASLIQDAQTSGNPERLKAALNQRRAQLIKDGLPTETTDDSLALIDAGNMGQVISGLGDAVNLFNQGKGGQRAFAPQQSAPITDPVTGQVSTPVFDPNTQTTKLVPIEGAIQETPTQRSQREFSSKEKEAELDVRTTQRKEVIKKTVARNSALKTQFSTQRRLAANSFRKIKEAQKLAESATQGLAGVSKVQLGRLFPGIDTGDEAALTGAFKSLALDELQKFTGPTTDFEFRVTEDIAGSLGDGASANKARLASLERASWFSSREAKQFSEHQKAGHDPDEFFFNFNELLTPKKGGKSYSLQSLQDTAVVNHISIDEVIKRLSK